MIFDTFMFGHEHELDLLECRLYELQDVPGVLHVAVEADVDHQGHAKPYYLTENRDRFDAWTERLAVVRASGLPEGPDSWARERAQREYATVALDGIEPDDTILHGDLDEIPRAEVLAAVDASHATVAFEQVGLYWSVRWRHPVPWAGTVATSSRDFSTMNELRDARNMLPRVGNAGWHLSWLGGVTDAVVKLAGTPHTEILPTVSRGLYENVYATQGVHVDGVAMTRVQVDETFPRWIREGKCPESWML